MPKSSTANRTPRSTSSAIAARLRDGRSTERLDQLEHDPVPVDTGPGHAVATTSTNSGSPGTSPARLTATRPACRPAPATSRPPATRSAAPTVQLTQQVALFGDRQELVRASSPRSGAASAPAPRPTAPRRPADHRLVVQLQPVVGQRLAQLALQVHLAVGRRDQPALASDTRPAPRLLPRTWPRRRTAAGPRPSCPAPLGTATPTEPTPAPADRAPEPRSAAGRDRRASSSTPPTASMSAQITTYSSPDIRAAVQPSGRPPSAAGRARPAARRRRRDQGSR